MVAQTRQSTVEEFEQFVALPENADRLFEYIGGEIVEMVSNSYSSEIAFNVGFFIKWYLRERSIGGRITGADGGYRVSGQRLIPDIAFTSIDKQPESSREAYNPIPPDLAVEVLEPDLMSFKVASYLAAGTLVWVVNPDKKHVEVYTPGQPPKRIGLEGTVDGGDVLPGFSLAVKDIFPAE